MTAQSRDILVFEQRPFELMSVQGTGLFDPRQEGLVPQWVSTGCYRGFDCVYRIDEKLLLLEAFSIGLKPLDRLEVKYGKGKVLRGQQPHLKEDAFLAVYEQLGWHVPFTGGLVVARDFIPGLASRSESVVSRVLSPIWMFSVVHELHFVEGQWTESFDCSSAMDALRHRIAAEPDGDEHEIHRFLANTFRRSYRGLEW
ncbi:hypothetical protein D7X30_40900 [Corallococcus sp. AB011P]|uniref:hypothetical protein n=1 Tax=Corallococcus sp. AB011P TaxID=2316735 RepID=UPI000EA13308|nr:hypothetical protein [Corallococcus sp. AB011P]RKG48284.1 hypothetical protein D7X30_40900 [Corallococcus sp. AB011P]